MTTLLFVFRKKTLDFFVQCPQLINETNKCLSELFYVHKLIPLTRRMQCRQLGQKKMNHDWSICDQCPKMMRKKSFWQKIFTIKRVQLTNRKQYWRSDQQKFAKWQKKLAQCPMMKWKKDFFSKKNSSTDLLGHNVSSFDNAADCCPKKSLDFFAQGLQMINETNKYFSKRFYVFKLTPWTRRMQCRQLGRKKFRTKTEIFAIYVQKLWEKKILTKIFSPQTGLIDKQKKILTTGPTNFRRNDRKKSLHNQRWNRKRFFFKKQIWAKYPPGHVVSSCDKSVKTKLSPQNDPLES